jgi:hypothetical protein
MTTTTAPQFATEVVTKAIDTETKTTQGKTFFNYFATQDFTLYLQYNQVRTYKAGDKVDVEPCKEGFGMIDGYRCHIIDAIETNGVKTNTHIIPTEWIVRREFCIVREYKTTVFEIL